MSRRFRRLLDCEGYDFTFETEDDGGLVFTVGDANVWLRLDETESNLTATYEEEHSELGPIEASLVFPMRYLDLAESAVARWLTETLTERDTMVDEADEEEGEDDDE